MRHFRPPSHFVTPILDILESVSNRGEMAAAGPLRTLQIALEDMTPALSRRLADLQRHWGMVLTESSPVR